MDRLQTMKTFVKVVEEGGFAAAARALDVDQAWVTRQVADLERHLGVRLLERTTRSMRLSEAGDTYLARCRAILREVEEAEALVGRSQRDMVGRVRLALPTSFGKEGVAERLAALHAAFPELTVEVAMLDRPVDPVAEGFDVVIMDSRLGVPQQAVARALLEAPYMLCVAPSYLARHGAPATPEDLVRHHGVAPWAVADAPSSRETWTLEHADGRKVDVDVPVALRTNTQALALEAVRYGMGIGRITPRMLADDLATGRLVRVMPEWHAGRVSLQLVYPGRRHMPRRVRHVIDNILAARAEMVQQDDAVVSDPAVCCPPDRSAS